METCEACGGQVKVIANIEDSAVIEHILKYLKQKAANRTLGQVIPCHIIYLLYFLNIA